MEVHLQADDGISHAGRNTQEEIDSLNNVISQRAAVDQVDRKPRLLERTLDVLYQDEMELEQVLHARHMKNLGPAREKCAASNCIYSRLNAWNEDRPQRGSICRTCGNVFHDVCIGIILQYRVETADLNPDGMKCYDCKRYREEDIVRIIKNTEHEIQEKREKVLSEIDAYKQAVGFLSTTTIRMGRHRQGIEAVIYDDLKVVRKSFHGGCFTGNDTKKMLNPANIDKIFNVLPDTDDSMRLREIAHVLEMKKKNQKKESEDEEEMEQDQSDGYEEVITNGIEHDDNDKTAVNDEEDEQMETEQAEDEEEKQPVAAEDGERSMFKVLGNQELKNLESLRVTSSWVQNATTFSATIDSSTSQKLSKIVIPEHLTIPSAISTWFPVQYSVLPTLFSEIRSPPALRPRDVAIAAPTGSGKTICYVLPVLAAVGSKRSNLLHALILVPVQTLVSQIVDEFRRWNGEEGVAKVVSLSGANDFEKEARQLAADPPNVIVATPARLMQHLTATIPPRIDLTRLRFLIVDEADRMGKLMREEWLDLVEFLCGGMERVACLNDILRQRRAPQKIVLSATLSKDVEELHLWNLFQPRLFSATATKVKDISSGITPIDHVSGRLALPSSISHRIVVSDSKFHPLAVYQQILRNNFNRTLIFVNEVASSNRLAHVLKELCKGELEVDYFTAQLFGKRRYKMLEKFNKNDKRVLICSDVLARGTDLNRVDCVINYNLPADDKLFVHRAGRTGRAGQEGYVISVGDKESKRLFIKMLKVTNLWGETVEEQMEEYLFEKDMDRYSKALESLKASVSSQDRKNDAKRSGFEAKRKSRPNARGEKPWLKKKDQEAS